MLLLLMSLFYSGATPADCALVEQLAAELGISATNQNAIWSQIQSGQNCCQNPSTSFVTCAFTIVVEINWSNKSLTGTINGTNLPPSLKTLVLSENQIYGTIPTALPTTLTHLDLNGNYLNGTIHSFPSGLNYIDLSSNQLLGAIPAIPSSATHIDLSSNFLTGTVQFTQGSATYVNLGHNSFSNTLQIPSSVATLLIENNQFSDLIVQSPQALKYCNISNNQFTAISHIASLTMCVGYVSFSTENPISFSPTATPISILHSVTSLVQKSTNIYPLSSLKSVTSLVKKMTNPYPLGGLKYTSAVISTSSTKVSSYKNSQMATTSQDSSTLNSPILLNRRRQTFQSFLGNTTVWNLTTALFPTATNSIHSTNDIASGNPSNSTSLDLTESPILYLVLGALVVIMVSLLLAAKFIKHPKIHSKFGRKNSFGTLNTVNTQNQR